MTQLGVDTVQYVLQELGNWELDLKSAQRGIEERLSRKRVVICPLPRGPIKAASSVCTLV